MLTVYHLRDATRDQLLAAVDQQLRSEGFVPDPVDGEGYRPQHGGRAPKRREIVIAEGQGWVGITDDPFASTAWGARLSRGLGVPVLEMSAECDHAFFSKAVLFEDGEEAGASNVPEDAVHEADGRHRIRPTFLARLVPEAMSALEAGVVVAELGGEGNIDAVGRVLGISRPQVRSYDEDDTDQIILTYRHEPGEATARPFGIDEALEGERDPLGVEAQLRKMGLDLSGIDVGALGPEGSLMTNMLAGMMASLGAGKGDDDGDDLAGSGWEIVSSRVIDVAPGDESEGDAISLITNGGTTRMGREASLSVDVSMRGDRPVRGLTIELSGAGLDLLDVTELASRSRIGGDEGLRATAERTGDGALLFRFPTAAMSFGEAAPEGPKLSPAEALRQRMREPMFARFAETALASYSLGAFGVPQRAGKGKLRVCVRSIDPPSKRVEIVDVVVEPPLREPVLPSALEHPAMHDSALSDYAARSSLTGWLAWDGSWSDVAALTQDIAHQLLAVATPASGGGFEASVRRRGGESLRFPAPVVPSPTNPTWKKILVELARGASVELLGPTTSRMSPRAEISLTHLPPGTSLYDDEISEDRDRIPIVLAFSIPRPDAESACRALAEAARAALVLAGAHPCTLGGFTTAGGYQMRSDTTSYESLLDLRHEGSSREWCRDHVRTPGWAVLVPPGVRAKLSPSPAPARVEQLPLEHATLVAASTSKNPFTITDDELEAVEKVLLPLLR